MLSKLPIVGRVLSIVIGVVGVVLFLLVALSSELNVEVNAGRFVMSGVYFTIAGIVIAIFSFGSNMVVNPASIKGIGIGLGLIIAVALISYFTANGADYQDYKDVTEQTSKLVSAMLNAFYVVFAGAVLAVVYSVVSRTLK